ncbi:hypothetical protein ACFL2J_02015 [Candidatus Omnitrophota bacterium]
MSIKATAVKIADRLIEIYVEKKLGKDALKDKQIGVLEKLLIKELSEKYEWKDKSEKLKKEQSRMILMVIDYSIKNSFDLVKENFHIIPKEEISEKDLYQLIHNHKLSKAFVRALGESK